MAANRGYTLASTILLIRHAAHGHLGETLTGRLDGVPLSDDGRAQAARLAERLAAEPIACVFTSPRQRARETAAAIAGPHELVPGVAHEIDEIDFGLWTGKRFAELDGDPAWDCWNARRGDGVVPGGEAAAAAQARAFGFLQALGDGPVAVVTHADIIRSVVCAVLGLSLDHLLRFDVDAASVTRLAGVDRLISLNERTA